MRKDVHVLGETAQGKRIGFYIDEGLYRLAFKEGGQLPSSLEGRYSDLRALQALVQGYINASFEKAKAPKSTKAKKTKES